MGRSEAGRVARAAAAGAAAALVAGVVVSVPARVLMRLVRLATGAQPQFSWAGSVGIAAVFVLAVLPGAVLAAVTRRRRWWLLAVGAALLFVPATGVASDELGRTAGFSRAAWLGVMLAGAGVYACIVAMPFLVLALVRRWTPRRS